MSDTLRGVVAGFLLFMLCYIGYKTINIADLLIRWHLIAKYDRAVNCREFFNDEGW